MNNELLHVLKKIEEEVYLNPQYTVDQLCWDLQDRKDFFFFFELKMRAESVTILCDIKFEWTKKERAVRFLSYYLQNVEKFEELKEILQDVKSKEVLEWLIKKNMAYAVCGDIAKRLYDNLDCVVSIDRDKRIVHYQNIFEVHGYRIYASEQELYDTWVRKQYLLEGICEPEKGDVVLSVGAFYGETSIWFSERVGDFGKVYAFEAVARNAWVAECNCRRNGIKNILVENSCLWSAEQSVYVEQDDAASRVSENTEGTEMKAITLDTYCEKNRISKVDYIKMDIEGAEYEALLGTENVIRKNKPKLAICVYHSAEDFIRIPQKIKEYVPEYRLYLSHKNEDLNETVVFATV